VPELPEVQALAEKLGELLTGRSLSRVDVAAVHALKTFDPPPDALVGRPIRRVDRLGKMLDLDADGLHLVVHLARGGWVHLRASAERRARPGRSPIAVRLAVDDSEGLDVTEAGTQKRLAVYVVTDVRQVPPVAALGPDALAVDEARFAAILRKAKGQVKTALRDQRLLAGIGNAYSDEMLHAARISPFRLASSLEGGEVAALFQAMGATLTGALERARAAPLAELKDDKRQELRVHGRAGQPCPVCGDSIRSVFLGDSSLQYCPTCQTGGRVLADRRLSKLLR
jgi:formamidopyrimidine-DNA glycosylase